MFIFVEKTTLNWYESFGTNANIRNRILASFLGLEEAGY
jgi:hypothetical protein